MALSNTATPIYYGLFRDAVLRGEIPVSEEVAMQMYRVDQLIANPNFYYDDKAIDGFIKYCEGELTLTDGSRVKLLDSFKLWAEDALSWFYFEERTVYEPFPEGHGGQFVQKYIKRRLCRKQYLIVARGSAKSMYASFLQAYVLNVDTTTTVQITTAPTMKQAEEVTNPIKTAIQRAPGPYFQFMTEGSIHSTSGSKMSQAKLVSTKKGIENRLTNSIIEVRPMSIDKLQGARPKLTTIDEWLSGDVREDVVGAIEQGATKVEDYLIVAISSEGTIRNGVGDSIKMELTKILRGEFIAPQVSIWWYKLDNVKEVAHPEMWLKAQPNLGKTVPYEAYHLDVERAEQNPAARNDILAKRFGLPMAGFTHFFTYEETKPHQPYSPHRYHNMSCAMGMDLSQGDDFTAFTFLFPLRDGYFGVKTRSYISSITMAKLHNAARAKYEEFIEEGSLHVFEGVVLDMMDVYDDLEKFIERNKYNVVTVGYDPYNAQEFIERWRAENGPYGVEMVKQGARTESVPLGELKKLAEQRLLVFDEELMAYAMGNAVTSEDTNGNRKLHKMRQDQKIDNVAALMDAWVAYKLNKDALD